jgi:hypothetical protein
MLIYDDNSLGTTGSMHSFLKPPGGVRKSFPRKDLYSDAIGCVDIGHAHSRTNFRPKTAVYPNRARELGKKPNQFHLTEQSSPGMVK